MAARRDHEFTGIDLGSRPSWDELWSVLQQLDEDFELQRLRLLQVFDWLEEAVTSQVTAELRAEDLEQRWADADGEIARLSEQNAALCSQLASAEAEILALHQTKLMRSTRVLRGVYGRLRRTNG